MAIKTPAWVRDAVFYQVFPDRFARSGRVRAPGPLEPWADPPTEHGVKGGDLYGVVEHLDRLRRLGVNALYLNPVFASASNHRYHTDDYDHVDPLLGGDDALRELVDQAHARDMRVVLDGVFNHCGRGWWPFHHVLENGPRSPYRDWFHLDAGVLEGTRPLSPFPSDAQLAEISARQAAGAPMGSGSREILGYEAWWDMPALPKLDLDQPEVRSAILGVVEHWTRFGIDGWRLDVAEEVGADFWREFRQRVRAANPEAYLVAEIWQHKPEWLQGDMFDAFMNYPLTRAILGFSAQGHLDRSQRVPIGYQGADALVPVDGSELWARIEELRAINDPAVSAVQLNLLGSHDTPRARSLCGGDLDSIRLATLLQMTLPGAPCIYYGDEIGMRGTMDPDCRGAFPADPDEWQLEPHDWIADLAALRHSSRAMRDGDLTLLASKGLALAYLRRDGADAFAIVFNAGEEPLGWELSLPFAIESAEAVALRSERPGRLTVATSASGLRVSAPPRHGGVVRLQHS